MLEFLRKASDTIFFKILFILLALSFFSWGIIGYLGGRSSNKTAIEAGDRSISLVRLDEILTNQEKILKQKMNFSEIPNQLRGNLLGKIISELKTDLLLNNEAENLGIVVSKEKILDMIKNSPEFKDDKGNFSKEKLERFLRFSGITQEYFVAITKEKIQRDIIKNLVISGILPGKTIARQIYMFEKDGRIIDGVKIAMDKININENPKDEDLKLVYNANQDKFVDPEYRKISYVIINEKAANKLEGSKSISSKMYNLAESVIDEIAGGSTLKEAADNYKVNYISLNPINKNGVMKNGKKLTDKKFQQYITEAFEAEKGIESDIKNLDNELLIFMVEDVIKSKPKPFKEVKNKAKNLWLEKEKIEFAARKATEIETALSEGKPIPANNYITKYNNLKVTRAGAGNKFSAQFLTKVLSQDIGKTVVNKTDDFYEVGIIKSIAEIDMENINDKDLALIQGKLLKAASYNTAEEYLLHLQEKYGVDVNQELIERAFFPKQ